MSKKGAKKLVGTCFYTPDVRKFQTWLAVIAEIQTVLRGVQMAKFQVGVPKGDAKIIDTEHTVPFEIDGSGCLLFRHKNGTVIQAFAPGGWTEVTQVAEKPVPEVPVKRNKQLNPDGSLKTPSQAAIDETAARREAADAAGVDQSRPGSLESPEAAQRRMEESRDASDAAGKTPDPLAADVEKRVAARGK